MIDYKDINYKKNYLNQVIIRIDFLRFYETEKIFTNDIETAISRHFPSPGMLQILRFNTLTEHYKPGDSAPAHSINYQDGKQKKFESKDKQNKVILSNKYIIFEINKYQNYEQVSEYLRDILVSLFSQSDISTNRVGIRYINIFDSQKTKIYQKYFVSEIANALKTKKLEDAPQIKLVRSMHTNEYTIDGMTLNFRYGLHNPQYPNPLSDNSFVLDYDCFVGDAFDNANDVIKAIDEGHNNIQALFESSITDALRKEMQDE